MHERKSKKSSSFKFIGKASVASFSTSYVSECGIWIISWLKECGLSRIILKTSVY